MTKTILSSVLGLLMASASALAQPCAGSLPNTLTNGTNADATQVMANFTFLLNCINGLTVAPVAPTGRLTLSTGTPVMTSDVPSATTIYYTPYAGARVPIYDGTQFIPLVFSQLSASTTAANQVANGIYDLFVFSNSGTVTLAFGPAWSSATARSASLQQVQGLWTNQSAITLTSSASSYTGILANRATYVGTVAITATAGQMAMQFKPTPASGGNNTWLGVWNAYNRVTVRARSAESASFWDYASATLRPVNNSTSNRINWVDGLQQSRILAEFNQNPGLIDAGSYGAVAWDSTSTPSGVQANAQNYTTSTMAMNVFARDTNILIGRHYVQALEAAQHGTPRFYGSTNASLTVLEVELEM